MPINKRMSAQQKTIERIANPRTPSDFILALQNPHSAVFKQFMAELMMGQAIHELTELMIHRFIDEKCIATQHEKYIIQKELIAKALADESDERHYMAQPQIDVNERRLNELGVDEFKQRLEKRVDYIAELQKQIRDINHQLVSLHQDIKTNTKDWQDLTKKLASDYTATLADNNIQLVTASGRRLVLARLKDKK